MICNYVDSDIVNNQKFATNLPQASKFVETFIGQDKNGPYILTWKNIIINFNNSFNVLVDNQRLASFDYDINSEKGEIHFKKPLRKNQVASVQYYFLPQYSVKNANPSQINTNNLTFTGLGLKGLSLTTVNNSNSSAAPNMVLSYNQKIGGLSANYLTDLNDINKNKNAMILGYSAGNSVNKFNVSYGKTEAGFSPYAKTFNVSEANEKSSIDGNYNFSKNTKLNFSSTSSESLTNTVANQNNVGSFNYSPNNKINFDLNYNSSDNTDAKNIRTASNKLSGLAVVNVKNAKFTFTDLKNSNIVNNAETINNQSNFSFDTSNLNFTSKNEYKQDSKNGFSDIKVDSLTTKTKIAGGNFVSNYNKLSSNINGKIVDSSNLTYGFNYSPNKSGFGGIKFSSSQNNDSLGNNNENMNYQSSFVLKNFQYSTNQNKTMLNSVNKINVDEEKLIIAANPTKNIPILKFESVDDIKRNDKGILIGKSYDLATIKTINNKSVLNYQVGNVINVISDDKQIETIVNSANINVPFGRANFFTELASNVINENDASTKNDVNKFSFNLTPNKKIPGISIEKSINSLENNNLSSDDDTNKYKINGSIGQISIATYLNQNSQDKNKNNFADIVEQGVNIDLSGKFKFNINQIQNDTSFTNEQKRSISLNYNANKNINLNLTQSKNQLSNADQLFDNIHDNYLELNYNRTNTLIKTGYKTISSFNNKTEIFKYHAKFDVSKNLAHIDSLVELRDSTDQNSAAVKDTSITKLSFNPIKNISLSGAYELNPYDAAKPNILTPLEKRTYGLTAKVGNFTVLGSYSDLEHLPGTSADIISKNGGFNYISETGYKLNYRDSFFGEYKEQFFNGMSIKGNSIFTLGYNIKNNLNKSLSFSASSSKSYNNIVQNNDIRADFKYVIKY